MYIHTYASVRFCLPPPAPVERDVVRVEIAAAAKIIKMCFENEWPCDPIQL